MNIENIDQVRQRDAFKTKQQHKDVPEINGNEWHKNDRKKECQREWEARMRGKKDSERERDKKVLVEGTKRECEHCSGFINCDKSINSWNWICFGDIFINVNFFKN